jgi:hypothetical protein
LEVAQPPPGYVLVPERRRGRPGLIAAVAVATLFAVCCVGGVVLASVHLGGSSAAKAPVPPATTGAPATTTKAKPKPSPTTVVTPQQQLPGAHAPVNDGKFQFTVGTLSCGHATVEHGVFSKTAQGQYCLLGLTVRNIGTEARTFADSFQKAFGPGGTQYGPDTGAGVIANAAGTAVFTLINPGNQVTGTIVFDIPKNAAIATVELHDSPLSHGVKVAVG